MSDGCLEAADGGLSRLGNEFIAEVNRLNILLDLSHAGPRTIAEGIAASKVPMAITHTGCCAPPGNRTPRILFATSNTQ